MLRIRYIATSFQLNLAKKSLAYTDHIVIPFQARSNKDCYLSTPFDHNIYIEHFNCKAQLCMNKTQFYVCKLLSESIMPQFNLNNLKLANGENK